MVVPPPAGANIAIAAAFLNCLDGSTPVAAMRPEKRDAKKRRKATTLRTPPSWGLTCCHDKFKPTKKKKRTEKGSPIAPQTRSTVPGRVTPEAFVTKPSTTPANGGFNNTFKAMTRMPANDSTAPQPVANFVVSIVTGETLEVRLTVMEPSVLGMPQKTTPMSTNEGETLQETPSIMLSSSRSGKDTALSSVALSKSALVHPGVGMRAGCSSTSTWDGDAPSLAPSLPVEVELPSDRGGARGEQTMATMWL
mmetsp:Transcript_102305/g.257706  ORF Transcript_102305/g.257706 Transcript_102305/m.257706 type:complete len:251 (+) Transcript_102305:110-862(+)